MQSNRSFVGQIDPSFFGYLGLLGFLGHYFSPFKYFDLFYLLFLYPYVVGSIQGVKQLRYLKARSLRIHVRAFIKPLIACVINPFILRDVVQQTLAEIFMVFQFLLLRPDVFGMGRRQKFMLPFSGQWVVMNGGTDRHNSHSWGLLNQRYAYDFVLCGDEQPLEAGRKPVPENYESFGQTILAPADGCVVRVKKSCRDYAKTGDVDLFATGIDGNYVMIEHDRGIVSVLAHLQKDSITVSPGDRVQQGQPMGRCGNSGHSTQPHLHFQVQTSRIPHCGLSLPVMLAGHYIQRDMIVENP